MTFVFQGQGGTKIEFHGAKLLLLSFKEAKYDWTRVQVCITKYKPKKYQGYYEDIYLYI